MLLSEACRAPVQLSEASKPPMQDCEQLQRKATRTPTPLSEASRTPMWLSEASRPPTLDCERVQREAAVIWMEVALLCPMVGSLV